MQPSTAVFGLASAVSYFQGISVASGNKKFNKEVRENVRRETIRQIEVAGERAFEERASATDKLLQVQRAEMEAKAQARVAASAAGVQGRQAELIDAEISRQAGTATSNIETQQEFTRQQIATELEDKRNTLTGYGNQSLKDTQRPSLLSPLLSTAMFGAGRAAATPLSNAQSTSTSFFDVFNLS